MASKGPAPAILVAMPSLKDSFFEKTVILLCDYSEEGALGFVINNPSSVSIKDILSGDLSIKNSLSIPLLFGGPVEQERLWTIHSQDFKSKTTTKVTPTIYLSDIYEVLSAVSKNEGPEKFHMGCGYAGWSAGQLDQEIERDSWWLADINTELVLEMDYSQRWDFVLNQIGIDPLSSYFSIGDN